MSDPTDPGQVPPTPPYQPPNPPPSYPPSSYPAPGYLTPGYPAPSPAYGTPPPPYGYAPMPAPYAHWGLRVASYLLDAVLLLPFYIVAVTAVAASGNDANGDPAVGGLVVMAVAYAGALGFMIWNQIVRQGRTGQSLGKQWVGTRLVREDTGLPLGGWLTFGRSLLHFLDGLPCYLGYLWPLWDAKRQTFADKIVRSVVLHDKGVPPGYPTGPAPDAWLQGPPLPPSGGPPRVV